ncbi:Splicing factor 3A subunit [Brachionus plicatilis]|uniref:Splicing factor 3A subunit n=1 Tax=Brachionus plicatilis TaxID=10195 RepID=A0A3M7P801_BRAPC|nr:Splicing factor 3A subunit [Brachionus plicatilis]RMZ95216.1 Splicing factor 3A subunit [Brachionus plicatilis]
MITSALNTTVVKQAPPQPPSMVSGYKVISVPPQPAVQAPVMPTAQTQSTAPQVHMPAELEEPASKRQKTEEHLIPEAEFLSQYQARGPIKFYVQCPIVAEKPEWNLNGQSISLTMALTEPVVSIKNKLTELLGIPAGKQKLQLDALFIKDQNTLAYYNMYPESVVQLHLKERGGRKK